MTAHVLATLVTPRWDKTQLVPTGADGAGVFTADALAGGVVIVLLPGLGLKYEF